MGYCGGSILEPTYHHLERHAETLEVDFDPAVIAYEEILRIFFESHRPTRPSWGTQYRSAIFCANADQIATARRVSEEMQSVFREKIYTEISPIDRFWWAEDYHQKYMLRHATRLGYELAAIYPKLEDFVNSPTAARVNAFLGGNGSLDQLETEIARYGLSPKAQEELRDLARRRGVTPATCPLAKG